MNLFILCTNGGAWSNGDVAGPGVMGVFSTQEKLNDAYMQMMRDEITGYLEASDEDEDCDGYVMMDLHELEELWCEKLECEALFIIERELDASCVEIHSASE